jgi:beta-mannosidase
LDINLKNPQLWWPNGAGEQPLYNVTAVLLDSIGKELHRKTVETGIRTAEIEELPDSDSLGRSFTIRINGKRIFAKGGNWVPADPFPSRITEEKYALLLGQARDAGMNMLRIWGGGIYEPETFWHLCNKLGIMVSQDFMLACQAYPDDDKNFVELLKKEFTVNACMIRNNPSLIFWCGDNELGLGNKPSDTWPCKLMHQTMTAPLMASLDPSRIFRITSPMSTDPLRNNSALSGDSHMSAYYEEKTADYRSVIDKFSGGRYMSEHAAAGLPPKRVLLKFMTEDDLYTSEMIEYHTKDNPYNEGGLTLFRRVEQQAENLYGNPGNDQERRIHQMEYLQYEVVRLALESSRRRKFYTSGIQFWMYNDCWPASGWSMIDYWGGRKAAWYAMSSGCRPVIAASETTGKSVKWWVTSDLYTDIKAEVEVQVQPCFGKARWTKKIEINIPANSSIVAMELPLKEIKEKLRNDAVLVCTINYNKGSDRSYWTPGLPQDIKYPKATLKVTQKKENNEGEATIHTDNWARVVTLDAEVDFEDNYFEMLPGETRTIKWKSKVNPFTGQINVSCWNL